jgi:iron complex transport system substrate-binding protein
MAARPLAMLAVALLLLLRMAPALAGAPERIVSLAPSVTETLFAMGLGERIVAVTTFCDYPPEAREKPRIGGMSNPSLEAIVSARPDMVVMTTDGNPPEIEDQLDALGIETYVFTARRMAGLPGAVREAGQALGAGDGAEELATRLESALRAYRHQGPSRGQGPGRGRALFVIWPEPLVVAGPGTVIDDALGLLGYENVAGGAVTNYPKYSLEEALRRQPEVIFIGLGMGREDMAELASRFLERLENTPAVRDGRVHLVSDHLFRFGPRVVPGMEELLRVDHQLPEAPE